jgi:nucleotide-binding universal stress UspA family protein
MKRFEKILVPTDLSENSRRGLRCAFSLAADNRAELTILHVANEFAAWEPCSDELAVFTPDCRSWPLDRLLSEARLDLNRFIEPYLGSMKNVASVATRVLLGPIPQSIAKVAEDERIDLIVLTPRRIRGIRRLVRTSITETVTRLSPCPVLTLTPPVPSPNWRGRLIPKLFGWPRQTTASLTVGTALDRP